MRNLTVSLYILSFVFIIIGFVVTFLYGEFDSDLQRGNSFGHVVGGDAYNYIIIGIRGLGFIITGLTCSVIATGILIYSALCKQRVVEGLSNDEV